MHPQSLTIKRILGSSIFIIIAAARSTGRSNSTGINPSMFTGTTPNIWQVSESIPKNFSSRSLL